MTSWLRVQKPAVSWAFYDFANTVFSAVVLTVYFPLYLTEITRANWTLGLATTGSMILAGLMTPFAGALSDQTGRTKQYLFRTTLLCCLFLVPLAFFHTANLLILFFTLSCLFYHLSLVFYNSLLVVVSRPENRGFISGLGTGLGYLGVVLSLPLAHWIEKVWGRPFVFPAAAVLFLIFSIPLFLWTPERQTDHPVPFRWKLWMEEWTEIWGTLQSLPSQPVLILFLSGNFLIVDALNAAIIWLAVYMREIFHLDSAAIITTMIGLNLSAFIGGIISGVVTDRIDALKTLVLTSILISVTLLGLVFISDFFWFRAVVFLGGGLAIAGIWTSGRKALTELVTPERTGEFFGLYGLTTKISVIGSFAFSIVADMSGFKSALLLLVFPAAMGTLLLLLAYTARMRLKA